MSGKSLLTVSLMVKKIVFNSPAVDAQAKIVASIKLLSYGEQTLFEPVTRPAEADSTLILDSGSSFTFGLGCGLTSSLAKRFVIVTSLHQTDPDKRLSGAAVDFSRSFRAATEELAGGSSKTQGKTTVKFLDEAGKTIALMDIVVRMTISGTTLVREFTLNKNGNVNLQFMSPMDGYRFPKAPKFQAPRKSMGTNDGEWDIVGAKFRDGMSIALKYRRNNLQVATSTSPQTVMLDEFKLSKGDQKFNSYISKMLGQMHDMLAASYRYVAPNPKK